jgi:hypothetical protein
METMESWSMRAPEGHFHESVGARISTPDELLIVGLGDRHVVRGKKRFGGGGGGREQKKDKQSNVTHA